MAKTQEELNELKEEYKKLTSKLKELSDDELKIVTGGANTFDIPDNNNIYEQHFYKDDVDKEKFIK